MARNWLRSHQTAKELPYFKMRNSTMHDPTMHELCLFLYATNRRTRGETAYIASNTSLDNLSRV